MSKIDRTSDGKDAEALMVKAAALPDYPFEEDSQFLFREYCGATRMVFIWVTPSFNQSEQKRYLQDYLREHFGKKTVLSVIVSEHKFRDPVKIVDKMLEDWKALGDT